MPCVDELVKLYFKIGFSNKEVISVLAHKHSVAVRIRTLKRLCRKLCLFRRKKNTQARKRWLHSRMLKLKVTAET